MNYGEGKKRLRKTAHNLWNLAILLKQEWIHISLLLRYDYMRCSDEALWPFYTQPLPCSTENSNHMLDSILTAKAPCCKGSESFIL